MRRVLIQYPPLEYISLGKWWLQVKKTLACIIVIVAIIGVSSILIYASDFSGFDFSFGNLLKDAGKSDNKKHSSTVSRNDEIYYRLTKADVRVKGFQRITRDGRSGIKIWIDWVNTSDGPLSLEASGLKVAAFQNGVQLQTIADTERMGEGFKEYKPGEEVESYFSFENPKNTEITFYISDMFDFDSMDIIHLIDPKELN